MLQPFLFAEFATTGRPTTARATDKTTAITTAAYNTGSPVAFTID